jgi:hypothetical protein
MILTPANQGLQQTGSAFFTDLAVKAHMHDQDKLGPKSKKVSYLQFTKKTRTD